MVGRDDCFLRGHDSSRRGSVLFHVDIMWMTGVISDQQLIGRLLVVVVMLGWIVTREPGKHLIWIHEVKIRCQGWKWRLPQLEYFSGRNHKYQNSGGEPNESNPTSAIHLSISFSS